MDRGSMPEYKRKLMSSLHDAGGHGERASCGMPRHEKKHKKYAEGGAVELHSNAMKTDPDRMMNPPRVRMGKPRPGEGRVGMARPRPGEGNVDHKFLGGLMNKAKSVASKASTAANQAYNTGSQYANQAQAAIKAGQEMGANLGAKANKFADQAQGALNQDFGNETLNKYAGQARNMIGKAQNMGNSLGSKANQFADQAHQGIGVAHEVAGRANNLAHQANEQLQAVPHRRGGQVDRRAKGGIGKMRHQELPRTGGSYNAPMNKGYR